MLDVLNQECPCSIYPEKEFTVIWGGVEEREKEGTSFGVQLGRRLKGEWGMLI